MKIKTIIFVVFILSKSILGSDFTSIVDDFKLEAGDFAFTQEDLNFPEDLNEAMFGKHSEKHYETDLKQGIEDTNKLLEGFKTFCKNPKAFEKRARLKEKLYSNQMFEAVTTHVTKNSGDKTKFTQFIEESYLPGISIKEKLQGAIERNDPMAIEYLLNCQKQNELTITLLSEALEMATKKSKSIPEDDHNKEIRIKLRNKLNHLQQLERNKQDQEPNQLEDNKQDQEPKQDVKPKKKKKKSIKNDKELLKAKKIIQRKFEEFRKLILNIDQEIEIFRQIFFKKNNNLREKQVWVEQYKKVRNLCYNIRIIIKMNNGIDELLCSLGDEKYILMFSILSRMNITQNRHLKEIGFKLEEMGLIERLII